MSNMSNYLEKALNDHVLGGPDFPRPATVHFALFTGVSDGEAGSVTQVSGGSYARAAVTNDSTNFPGAHATSGLKTNGTVITFPTATASWGTVTHWGVYDAASGGNLLYWGTLTASRTISTGDTPRFNTGEFSITFA
jgi:hypothetical protein